MFASFLAPMPVGYLGLISAFCTAASLPSNVVLNGTSGILPGAPMALSSPSSVVLKGIDLPQEPHLLSLGPDREAEADCSGLPAALAFCSSSSKGLGPPFLAG